MSSPEELSPSEWSRIIRMCILVWVSAVYTEI